jgi:hypothetical protein
MKHCVLLLYMHQDTAFCKIRGFTVAEMYNGHFIHVILNRLICLGIHKVTTMLKHQYS